MFALLLSQDASATAEIVEAIAWVDVTALAVVFVFFVAGILKGFRWQLGRVAILVAGYAIACAVGPLVAPLIAGEFDEAADANAPLFLAIAGLFAASVATLAALTHLLRRRDVEPVRLTAGHRLGGGLAGLLTALLTLLALFTGVQMLQTTTGIGARVVEAAERSISTRVERGVVRAASDVLPGALGDGAAAWNDLLLAPPRR
jgi:uncharacterized membrane protein required for colicin V production